MHLSKCLTEGGFKIINGLPKMGKGPMANEEDLKSSNEASLPQPTQAGRIDACMELISKAMKCLENNDKDCVMRKIEELVKADCHNGRLIGKEVADGVRELVHRLWLRNNDEERCELLRMLKSLNVSRTWATRAVHRTIHYLDELLARCGIDWENRTTRNSVIENIEGLLRERFGWSEVKMCEELWQFVGVNVNEFRKYDIEPCSWLSGLELLSDLRCPYWLGMAKSDLVVWKHDNKIRLRLSTTNAIDAIFFPTLLGAVKKPSLNIEFERGAPSAKYVRKAIALGYYVDLGINKWPWPELSTDELEKVLNSFSDEELAKYVAGEIDGDGTVWYDHENGYVAVFISACKKCPKRMVLDVLKEVIAERFGIVGGDGSLRTNDALVFYNRNAVRLLRLIRPFVHHPLRRLRIELILALYDGRISREVFEKLYKMTEYERGAPDVKRNHALEATTRATPQTHTHGEQAH